MADYILELSIDDEQMSIRKSISSGDLQEYTVNVLLLNMDTVCL